MDTYGCDLVLNPNTLETIENKCCLTCCQGVSEIQPSENYIDVGRGLCLNSKNKNPT